VAIINCSAKPGVYFEAWSPHCYVISVPIATTSEIYCIPNITGHKLVTSSFRIMFHVH